jgi:hypothetical protein
MEKEPVRRVRVRRSGEEIAELLQEYRQSGQTQREYCSGRGLSVSCLQSYLRRAASIEPGVRLREVEVLGEPQRWESRDQALAVRLPSGYEVLVGRGFESGELARLLSVLEGFDR